MTDLQVVEVRALETNGAQQRPGTYLRGGRTWLPGWHQCVVDAALLELISNDPWLQVKVLDAHTQARKKLEYAHEAKAKADALRKQLEEADAEVKKLFAAAEEASKAAKAAAPPPPEPPAPTPFQDAVSAATPEAMKPKAKK